MRKWLFRTFLLMEALIFLGCSAAEVHQFNKALDDAGWDRTMADIERRNNQTQQNLNNMETNNQLRRINNNLNGIRYGY